APACTAASAADWAPAASSRNAPASVRSAREGAVLVVWVPSGRVVTTWIPSYNARPPKCHWYQTWRPVALVTSRTTVFVGGAALAAIAAGRLTNERRFIAQPYANV